MIPFTYLRPTTREEAVVAADDTGALYLGGGTNLVDLMREGIARPSRLVDVSRLDSTIATTESGGLMIGAGVTNADVASSPVVLERYPLLAEAILNGASAQIRNMATVGGNLLQRTRCLYFYDDASRCNKREPSAGCDAVEGHNRMHAILGASQHCVATHPSDMCVGLVALEAIVHLRGPRGARSVHIGDFHRLPGDEPHIDSCVTRGELVESVELPPPVPGIVSSYRKVRERASYAFALVSIAAQLGLRDNRITRARLALGGVAHKPWRSPRAEEVLVGRHPTEEAFGEAAEAILAGARPLRDNAFKIELTRRLVVQTLGRLAERGVQR
jgi:xanthine dehydrogenase YagS FAD-binding subunit